MILGEIFALIILGAFLVAFGEFLAVARWRRREKLRKINKPYLCQCEHGMEAHKRDSRGDYGICRAGGGKHRHSCACQSYVGNTPLSMESIEKLWKE